MSATHRASNCATRYAECLLRAWVAGDWRELHEEIDRGVDFPGGSLDALEEEQIELVRAVAIQLKVLLRCDSHQAEDLRLRMCANLLQNLTVQRPEAGLPLAFP